MRTHLSAFRFHRIGHEKGPPKQRLLDDEYELLGGSGFKLTSPSQAGNPKPESASKSPNVNAKASRSALTRLSPPRGAALAPGAGSLGPREGHIAAISRRARAIRRLRQQVIRQMIIIIINIIVIIIARSSGFERIGCLREFGSRLWTVQKGAQNSKEPKMQADILQTTGPSKA